MRCFILWWLFLRPGMLKSADHVTRIFILRVSQYFKDFLKYIKGLCCVWRQFSGITNYISRSMLPWPSCNMSSGKYTTFPVYSMFQLHFVMLLPLMGLITVANIQLSWWLPTYSKAVSCCMFHEGQESWCLSWYLTYNKWPKHVETTSEDPIFYSDTLILKL